MRHLAQGVLRRMLDQPHSLTDDQRTHLRECVRCRATAAEVVRDAGRAALLLEGSARAVPEDESSSAGDRSRLQRRLAVAVIVAAVASVPATFLTALDGIAGQAGHVVNYLSLAVLTGESLVLLFLARDRWQWLRENWYVVAIVLVCIPAVILAVGPVQLLRLLRFVGALRILRVRRIFRAGRILRERAGLTDWRWRLLSTALSLVAAIFVAIVLADPTSESRRFIEGSLQRFGLPAIFLAGLILAGATFVVVRYRHKLPVPSAGRPGGSDREGSG